MVNVLRHLTLRRKFTAISLIASVGGLLIASAALILFDQYNARRTMADNLQITARLIAQRSSAAILFQDSQLAKENLASLRVNETVELACIVLPDGSIFGVYIAQNTPAANMGKRLCKQSYKLGVNGYVEGKFHIRAPIIYETSEIATLYLRAHTRNLDTRLLQFALVATLIALISGLLVFVIATRIQRTVAIPLLSLASLAKQVADKRDYSVRAKKDTEDEVGTLVDAFNSMLTMIEQQNEMMMQSSRELRELVRKKTEAEGRLFTILENAPDGIVTIDQNGIIQTANSAIEDIFGWSDSELIGHSIAMIAPDLQDRIDDLLDTSLYKNFENLGLRKNGDVFPVEMRFGETTSQGRRLYTGIVRDITVRKQAEEEIRVLSQAVEQSPSSVMITDAQGVIEYVNRQFEDMTGYSKDEYIQYYPTLLRNESDSQRLNQDIWQNVSNGCEWRGELRNQRKNGEQFWESAMIAPIRQENGEVIHFIRVSEDITIRKNQEQKLIHQANYDLLTGLPNRSLAFDRLQWALSQAKRSRRFVVMMFIDLDRFKYINDTLGHNAGDQLLIEASKRLKDCMREECTVARFGGDEFLVVLPNVSEPIHSEPVAQRILNAFQTPFEIENQTFFISASIGIAVYPGDGEDQETLLRNADTAMYRSKELGRNKFQYFTQAMNQKATERLRIETHLRQAIDRNEFSLQYQPMVDTVTMQLVGVEALLRWNNEELGYVGPDEFIPVAEDSDLIIQIGEWALLEACQQLVKWRVEGLPAIKMAVNFSPRQFRDPSMISQIENAVAKTGIQFSDLEIEITERVLLDDAKEVKANIRTLKELGVSLSIDDFGTGYSALSYLQKYPFDLLKIDRAFINDIVENAEDAALCNAIIHMAHSLGLRVIGEGVESAEQLRQLVRGGCDMIQGYYISRPVVGTKLLAFARQFEAEHKQTLSTFYT